MDRARDEFLPGPRFPVNEHGGVRRGDLLNGPEYGEQGRTIAHDFLEVVLGADLLSEVDVLPLQPRFQRRDLFVEFRVFDRQRYLDCYFQQKLRVLFGVSVFFPAHDAEGADALSSQNQRNNAEPAKALCPKTPLVGELLFFFEVAAERLLMVEYPACTCLGTANLQAGLEVIGLQSTLDGQEAERICLRRIERNRASIEVDERTHRFRNGTEQCFLGEVCDDGVVDIEEASLQVLALPQRLFRLFPLRDVDEGNDGSDGSTLPNYGMGPKLHGETGTILSPIDLVISMNALAVLKTYINRAFLDRIRLAIRPSVMVQRMHILPQQLGRVVISKQAYRGRITEKASAFGIATKDSLRGGIEYHPDSLLAFMQRLFHPFSLRNVFRKRHNKSRHGLGARNQRYVVAHPH